MPRDCRQRVGWNAERLCREIGTLVFEKSKYGAVIPKVLVLSDDVDPTNTAELVWAFATRCHPVHGEIAFDKEATSPLVAFLETSEKQTGRTTKVVYNCLPPDEWGERLPVRCSFAHNYPRDIQEKVLTNWHGYGFPKT